LKKYGSVSPFGSTAVQLKATNTVRERYGVDNVSQLDATKQKKIATSIEHWNCEYPIQNNEIRDKIGQTNLEKYGNVNYLASDEGKTASMVSMMKKYGVEFPTQPCKEALILLDDRSWLVVHHYELKKTIAEMGNELGVSSDTVSKYMKIHKVDVKYFYKSAGECEVGDFIKSLGVEFVTNVRNIINGELDIFIPEFNIAIEYNGLYWHSEQNGKDIHYHQNKMIECTEKGIRLLSIFEDEWKTQNKQCKDTIAHLLGKSEKGVYARNTIVKEISWKHAKSFLDEFHLLKAGSCGVRRIGAFDVTGALIGVMVFGNKNNEGSREFCWELKRFVTNKKNNPGLGSKMFKWAVSQYGLTTVVAFVDSRWFTGLFKNIIGFTVDSIVPPSLWWTNGKVRNHRRFTTKNMLKKITNQNTSKRLMMKQLGFYRIWDCGKVKLIWNISSKLEQR